MQKFTSAQYFKALTVLCYTLTGGLVFFSVIVSLLALNGFSSPKAEGLGNILNIIVPVLALVGLLGGNAVAKSRLLAIKEMPGLADRMNNYRGVVILRYALLEGPALFSVIAIFLTGELKLLIATAALILMMLYMLPTRPRLIKELELSSQEADIVNNPDAVIE